MDIKTACAIASALIALIVLYRQWRKDMKMEEKLEMKNRLDIETRFETLETNHFEHMKADISQIQTSLTSIQSLVQKNSENFSVFKVSVDDFKKEMENRLDVFNGSTEELRSYTSEHSRQLARYDERILNLDKMVERVNKKVFNGSC